MKLYLPPKVRGTNSESRTLEDPTLFKKNTKQKVNMKMKLEKIRNIFLIIIIITKKVEIIFLLNKI